jgi:hypothetical protein
LLADYAMKPPQLEQLQEFYRNWGFKGLLAALEGKNPARQQGFNLESDSE